MGRGYSEEQKKILLLAYREQLAGRDIFLSQKVLREIYGLKDSYFDGNHVESISAKAKAVRASFFRTIRRLRDRGLVENRRLWGISDSAPEHCIRANPYCNNRVGNDWGYMLTNAGKIVGERLYNEIGFSYISASKVPVKDFASQ